MKLYVGFVGSCVSVSAVCLVTCVCLSVRHFVCYITIVILCAHGACSTSVSNFTFTSAGPGAVTFRAQDPGFNNGTYYIYYTATVAGSYSIGVSVSGVALPGSPYQVTVYSACLSDFVERVLVCLSSRLSGCSRGECSRLSVCLSVCSAVT